MKRDAEGNPLVKRVEFLFFLPDGTKKRQVIKAGPRQGYTDETIDKMIADTVDRLENMYPRHEFRLVSRARNAFTFAHAGYRMTTPHS